MHCPHFVADACRSCSEIGLAYASQLAAKQAHAQAVLGGFAGLEWLPAVESPERGFRNKAKMAVGGTCESPTFGLLDGAGHGVDLQDCLLYPPALQAAFTPLRDFVRDSRLQPYDLAARRGELKYLLVTLAAHSGELMVRFVLRSQEAVGRMQRELPALQAALPTLRVVSVNLQPEHKAVLEGEREIVLSADDRLTMRLNGMPLYLRPKSFFQTNDVVAAALYRQVAAWADELQPAAVLDLYCGVGGFALHCAGSGRAVTGVECSVEAIASAEASRDAIGATGVRFEVGDATEHAATRPLPPLVVTNPPRRGLGAALCTRIEQAGNRWLAYSSCNIESLARDLKAMPSMQPRRARLLDMFPHTRHYELVLLAERE